MNILTVARLDKEAAFHFALSSDVHEERIKEHPSRNEALSLRQTLAVTHSQQTFPLLIRVQRIHHLRTRLPLIASLYPSSRRSIFFRPANWKLRKLGRRDETQDKVTLSNCEETSDDRSAEFLPREWKCEKWEELRVSKTTFSPTCENSLLEKCWKSVDFLVADSWRIDINFIYPRRGIWNIL